MRRIGRLYKTILLPVALAAISYGFSPGMTWQQINPGLPAGAVHDLQFVQATDRWYAATDRGLFTWTSSEPFRSQQLISSPTYTISIQPDGIYAASFNGLYIVHDNQPKEIYSASGESACLGVAVSEGRIWLGTSEGLLWRNREDAAWNRMGGALGRMSIFKLVSREGNEGVFALTDSALYEIEADSRSRVIFERIPVNFEETTQRVLKDFFYNPASGLIHVLTEGLILTSGDGGDTWYTSSTQGLDGSPLRKIVDGAFERPWVITEQGVYAFDYRSGRWQGVRSGLDKAHPEVLTSAEESMAIGGQGRFFILSAGETFSVEANWREEFSHEPSIAEVHAMAIHYADVSREKIERWKKQARLKVFVPDVGVSVGRAATDLYHWDTGMSPDVLTKGDEYTDWDVGLSWDLSDFVWSSDLTTIDSRAKLMVELREDILDQVTRLYFERRRAQMELAHINPDASWERYDKELRLQELTAHLDAFTGSQFSRAIQENATKGGQHGYDSNGVQGQQSAQVFR